MIAFVPLLSQVAAFGIEPTEVLRRIEAVNAMTMGALENAAALTLVDGVPTTGSGNRVSKWELLADYL